MAARAAPRPRIGVIPAARASSAAWALQTRLTFKDICAARGMGSPISRLAWLKESMHLANNMMNATGKSVTPEVVSAGDKAGLAMKAARALELGHWSTWDRCAAQAKELRSLLPPGVPRGPEAVCNAVAKAKDLATGWAREEVLFDLQELVDDRKGRGHFPLLQEGQYLEKTVEGVAGEIQRHRTHQGQGRHPVLYGTWKGGRSQGALGRRVLGEAHRRRPAVGLARRGHGRGGGSPPPFRSTHESGHSASC